MEDVVTRKTEEFKTLSKSLADAMSEIRCMRDQIKPSIMGERYLTGEEVCEQLHISKRTLQNWRDNGTLEYVKIGGKVLYLQAQFIQ